MPEGQQPVAGAGEQGNAQGGGMMGTLIRGACGHRNAECAAPRMQALLSWLCRRLDETPE